MNHENHVRYTVRFHGLAAAELDELTTMVARELGGNTFDAMTVEAVRNDR